MNKIIAATAKQPTLNVENNNSADGLECDYSVNAPELAAAVSAPQVETAIAGL